MNAEALWPRLGRYVSIIPTPKQAAFLLLSHKEVFYGGAAGGGKSVALLAAALQFADVPGYSALLVRRSYMELQQPNGLIDLSKRWLVGTGALWRESDYTWRFPSGATLTFRYLDGRSELAFQGGEDPRWLRARASLLRGRHPSSPQSAHAGNHLGASGHLG